MMNRFKKALLTCIVAGTVATTSTVLAVWVDGGTWNYGYTGLEAYSEYKHDYNPHGAKVVNSNNGVARHGNARAGAWARARVGTIWDPATFYYNPTGYY